MLLNHCAGRPVVVVYIEAILQNDSLRIERVVVYRLGVGVRRQKLQAVGKVLVQRHPQTVVAGITGTIDFRDVPQ
jgi:hypothetical protein